MKVGVPCVLKTNPSPRCTEWLSFHAAASELHSNSPIPLRDDSFLGHVIQIAIPLGPAPFRFVVPAQSEVSAKFSRPNWEDLDLGNLLQQVSMMSHLNHKRNCAEQLQVLFILNRNRVVPWKSSLTIVRVPK